MSEEKNVKALNLEQIKEAQKRLAESELDACYFEPRKDAMGLEADFKTVLDGCGRLILWAETWGAMQKKNEQDNIKSDIRRVLEDIELSQRGLANLNPRSREFAARGRMEEMAAELWVKVYIQSLPLRGEVGANNLADKSLHLFRERFQTDKTAVATSQKP